jgi:hypothetical protein
MAGFDPSRSMSTECCWLRAGLIETNERSPTILDLPGLRRITDMR